MVGATGQPCQSGLRPGVLLDRDGTIIVDHGYVGSVDRVEFLDGAPEAIAKLNRAEVPVAVVSNQAGVARGLFDISDVERSTTTSPRGSQRSEPTSTDSSTAPTTPMGRSLRSHTPAMTVNPCPEWHWPQPRRSISTSPFLGWLATVLRTWAGRGGRCVRRFHRARPSFVQESGPSLTFRKGNLHPRKDQGLTTIHRPMETPTRAVPFPAVPYGTAASFTTTYLDELARPQAQSTPFARRRHRDPFGGLYTGGWSSRAETVAPPRWPITSSATT